MLVALSQKRRFHLDRTGPAWVEANRLRLVERPKRQYPLPVFELYGLQSKIFASFTFHLRMTGEMDVNYVTETYSRLKLRQRGLKLWCDQLKWLIFDIKLLVSTVENI